MKVQATFTAKLHGDGARTLICRETGERYSYAQRGLLWFVYREGRQFAQRNSLSGALACIESDARWAIRDQLQRERELTAAAGVIGMRLA